MLCHGPSPIDRWCSYSKYFTTRKSSASPIVSPRCMRNLPKFFIFSDAQAMTIVTDDVMRTTVLNAAIGTFSSSKPCGHSVEPTRRRM